MTGSKSALRDMRVTADVEELLTGLLQMLSYSLGEMDVTPRYGSRDVRRISVARRGDETRLLLHIPAAVLRNEGNLAEFGLLRYMFPDGALISIISPKLTGFPRQSFALMVKDWQYRDNTKICFINWDWLKHSAEPHPDPDAFANLFEPPLTDRPTANATETPSDGDRAYIAEILASMAGAHPGGSMSYFSNLVNRLNLPEKWAIGDIWTGDLNTDASKLVEIIHLRGQYPSGEQKGFAVLGVLIMDMYTERGDPAMRMRFVEMLEQYQLVPPETRQRLGS